MLSARYVLGCVALLLSGVLAGAADSVYYPPKGEWAQRRAENVGMDSTRIQDAIDFSIAHENPHTKDMAEYLKETFAPHEPMWRLLGPTKPRGGMTGLVIRHGYVVAQWGDPARVDMTHSVTKTFLTTVVGLAWERKMIPDLTAKLKDFVPMASYFSSEHNAGITWDHLLRQTSDWSGTLWSIPDWADRPVGATVADQEKRAMHEPGSFFKYNDIRVNLLSLATLQVWKKPLPEVLRDELMNPIGASATWVWNGYENSWVEIDGKRMQSVSGGGHYGGGMFINAWDLARFGYLFLENGKWAGRPLVSQKWIALARTPGPANPTYGFANWFLNTARKLYPAAPATAVTFRGDGSNIVYIDQENDLVIVVRWIENSAMNEFLGKMLAAIVEQPERNQGPDVRK
jgi:CubicO group peptidase (beta-lactamase class C family)